jgi:hypothetical protein
MTRDLLLFYNVSMVLVAVLLAGCFLLGVAIALRPTLLDRLRGTADRRVSMRRLTRPLDVTHDIDRVLYRHHRLIGVLVVTLSAFVLVSLGLGYDAKSWSGLFDPRYREIERIVFDTVRVVLWGLALFSLLVGVTVFVRPSALKRIETLSNRWWTPRRATRALQREFHAPDQMVSGHPRAWGLGIAFISGVALVALLLQILPR